MNGKCGLVKDFLDIFLFKKVQDQFSNKCFMDIRENVYSLFGALWFSI